MAETTNCLDLQMTSEQKYKLITLLIECIETIEAAEHASERERAVALSLVERKRDYIYRAITPDAK